MWRAPGRACRCGGPARPSALLVAHAVEPLADDAHVQALASAVDPEVVADCAPELHGLRESSELRASVHDLLKLGVGLAQARERTDAHGCRDVGLDAVGDLGLLGLARLALGLRLLRRGRSRRGLRLPQRRLLLLLLVRLALVQPDGRGRQPRRDGDLGVRLPMVYQGADSVDAGVGRLVSGPKGLLGSVDAGLEEGAVGGHGGLRDAEDVGDLRAALAVGRQLRDRLAPLLDAVADVAAESLLDPVARVVVAQRRRDAEGVDREVDQAVVASRDLAEVMRVLLGLLRSELGLPHGFSFRVRGWGSVNPSTDPDRW